MCSSDLKKSSRLQKHTEDLEVRITKFNELLPPNPRGNRIVATEAKGSWSAGLFRDRLYGWTRDSNGKLLEFDKNGKRLVERDPVTDRFLPNIVEKNGLRFRATATIIRRPDGSRIVLSELTGVPK